MNKYRHKLPPRKFSNFLNDLNITLDWNTWQDSNEWKIFKAGYAMASDDFSRQISDATADEYE